MLELPDWLFSVPSVPLDWPVLQRRGLASETGLSEGRRPGHRAEEQQLQAGPLDLLRHAGWIRVPEAGVRHTHSHTHRGDLEGNQVTCGLWQLRVSLPREGLGPPRHPGHAAVQTQRVRQPDQPEHGERLGDPPLRHRHLPQAGRGQVPDPEGPQQGEALLGPRGSQQGVHQPASRGRRARLTLNSVSCSK